MKVYRYWVRAEEKIYDPKSRWHRGKHWPKYWFTSWGGSNESVSDAQQIAQAKMTRIVAKVQHEEPLNDYGDYGGDEIRETLIEEITNESGDLIAAVTRNRYGSLVLNTVNTFIADIDVSTDGIACGSDAINCDQPPSLWKRIRHTFGGPPPGPPIDLRAPLIQAVESFALAHPHYGIRLYATFAGLRLFIISEPIDPLSPLANDLLNTLSNDLFYQRLCLKQKCYRARLTPKPWRCDCFRPTSTLPDMSDERWVEFQEWLADYEEKSSAYSVCRLVNTWGPDSMSGDTEKIIALHDRYTLGDKHAKLA